MKTRLIFFVGGGFDAPKSQIILDPLRAAVESVPVRFFVPDSHMFEVDTGSGTLDTLAQKWGATRHDAFDFAVGNMGSQCSLFNLPVSALHTFTYSFVTTEWVGQWLSFPFAVRALVDGQCRRYLQLAVQYISSGGVDENVIAAHTDADFLKTLEDGLKVTTVN